ncbi:MAG: recombinase family protein, partial [Polyangiaceae bacterium]|nr:recombinase family protein [Polyangiaceae bacterium]
MQILSIRSQTDALRQVAERQGLTISVELAEACSAREPGRPIFSRLLKDIDAGRV